MEQVRVDKIACREFYMNRSLFEGSIRLTIESWYNPIYDEANHYIKVEFLQAGTDKVLEVDVFHQDHKKKLRLYLKQHLNNNCAIDLMKFVAEYLPEKFIYHI
jgi:hypothetical protein